LKGIKLILLQEKQDQLQSILRQCGRVAIAFSGGVDSALVVKCALDTLGAGNVLAMFAQSELQTSDEIEQAVLWPEHNGYAQEDILEIVQVQPLEWPEVAANPHNRCYHCKRRLYQLFYERMQQRGYSCLLDGTNCDDLSSHRPGLRAIDELGVRMPLIEAGFDKADVRALSRHLHLTTWDRLSSSCLATRIPTGVPITVVRLRKVAIFEEQLRRFGFFGCRVRLHSGQDDAVQIVIQNKEFELFTNIEFRKEILRIFEQHGINTVLLNLAGREDAHQGDRPEVT